MNLDQKFYMDVFSAFGSNCRKLFLLRALSACLLGAYVRYMQSTWRGLFEPSAEHCYEHDHERRIL